MKYDNLPPEQLLDQLVDNSASLCRANLDFKIAHQRGDELLRACEAKMDATRRFERRVLLSIFALAGIACGVHLLYPDWLPEQVATVSSLIK